MKPLSKFFLLSASAVALVAAGVGGLRLARSFTERRSTTQAETFLRNHDLRSASLTARQILQHNPRNADALRIMAVVTEAAGSPEVLLWKQRLADLTPGQPKPLEDLAVTALQLHSPAVAEQALAQIKPEYRSTAAYYQVSAAWAVSVKNFPQALADFEKALALDPQNQQVQFNLATVRLQLPDPVLREQARAFLQKLRNQPAWRLPAVRTLLSDARQRADAPAALNLANELIQIPEATPGDHLLYLEEWLHASDPSFTEKLRTYAESISHQPQTVYQLLTWMNAHGLAEAALRWSNTLTAEIKNQLPIPLALAEAYSFTADWNGLNALVSKANWGPLDFMRFAFQGRVLEMTQGPDKSLFRLKWDRALTATGGDPNALSLLAQMAEGWKWNSQAEQAWWILARRSSGQRPALIHLNRLYNNEKNTAELYRVSQRMTEIEPANLGASNNLAYFGLLLGKDLEQAHRVAENNYRQAPGQPAFVSTYALSLLVRKRANEAVRAMQSLPEAALQPPAMAACYGAMLTANGERDKARAFLSIASANRPQLLPEEAALVDRALQPVP